MSNQLRGFFKRITGEQASYDALTKQPITDAETKLKLFNDSTTVSVAALENYIKSLSKLIDQTLGEKFNESKDHFSKYEKPHDQIMGTCLGKMSLIHGELNNDVCEFIRNVEVGVLKPLSDYQEELKVVKENKKELKEAYDKIEQCRQNLEKYRREADSVHRSGKDFRISSSVEKKSSEILRIEDKVLRAEKEVDEANSVANEKYDKYTETLYKRIAEECDLSNHYVSFLNYQRRFHKRALKKLDMLIPDVDETIHNYYKKPVFGSDLEEYVERSRKPGSAENVSPVVKRLLFSMYMQNAFNEEGIFRIAGSRVKMNCLINSINAGYLDMIDTTADFDVHCLAGVLKQYIRELPDSLLCNDYYEDWIEAIGTPAAYKLEAYRNVLEKLPKVNYENLRYLIKFLAKIVENSDVTKMTTSNMGICFGVSLLSSSGPLNNNSNAKQTDKVIDMATATNVFDFLLSNQAELFTEELDFLNNVQKNVLASSSLSQSNKSLNSKDHYYSEVSSKTPETPLTCTNKLSMIQDDPEDSISELHNQNNSSSFHKGNLSSLSSSSPMLLNANNNINNSNRHIKKKSNESEFFASNNSINSVGSVNNGLSNKSSQSPSLHSVEPISPKRERSKKMAPAPPPIPRTTPNQSQNELNNSSNNIQTSPSSKPTTPQLQQADTSTPSAFQQQQQVVMVGPTVAIPNDDQGAKQSNIFPRLTSNTNATELSTLKINNPEVISQNETSPTAISPKSKQPKHPILEKPTQPPPNVPNRPPPIGFTFPGIQSDSGVELHRIELGNNNNNNKLASNSNSTLLSTSSSSTTSSLSQEISTAPTTHTVICNNKSLVNGSVKGPKPAVPRRPGSMIAAQIKQFDHQTVENSMQAPVQTKSTSEITSL